MSKYAQICCGWLAMACLGAAWANSDQLTVNDWLDRMAVAVDTLDYRGTMVQVRAGQISTFEVIRRVDETGIRERIYALDGPPQEMIRHGDQFRSTLSGQQLDWFQTKFKPRLMPHQPLDQLTQVGLAYDLSLGGQERIAGYLAQRIDIQPKDRYRFGQQLWLERQTGMLLRSAVVSTSGEPVIEQTFVSIDLGASVSDRDLEPQTAEVFDAPSGSAWEELVSDESTGQANEPAIRISGLLRPLWAPRQVPAHFRLINASHGRSDMDTAFDHLLFSDGLSSFSVYIDHAPTHAISAQYDALGTLNMVTGMMGNRQFTVMGQVPKETVEFVGQQFLQATSKTDP